MNVLAIDPAKTCGFAITNSKKVMFGSWFLSNQDRHQNTGQLILALRDRLNTLHQSSAIQGHIDLILIENVAFSSHTFTAHIYGAITGFIQLFAADNNIPMDSVTPAAWKKAIGLSAKRGNRSIKDDQYLPRVMDLYQLDRKIFYKQGNKNPKPGAADAAAALGILYWGSQNYDFGQERLPEWQEYPNTRFSNEEICGTCPMAKTKLAES